MLSKFVILTRTCAHFNYSTTSSNKIATGISGLKVDPSARSNLLKLYEELKGKLCQLPEDYVYKREMMGLLENRNKMIKNEAFSDLDLETKFGEGQLEELVEQAQEEIKLLEKLSTEWKPWEKHR
jgi:NADH dehydrogenase (ubiquinone) 1 alpha subcomplex subunit 5